MRRGALAVVLAACGTDRVEDVLALSGDADSGAVVWSARCQTCHGTTADGASGPALDVPADDAAFVEVVLYGQGDMSGLEDELTDGDVADLLEFAKADYGRAASVPCRATTTSPCPRRSARGGPQPGSSRLNVLDGPSTVRRH